MGTSNGAIADPATRHALLRAIAYSLVLFFGSVVLLVVGIGRFTTADQRQKDLVRDGAPVSGIVLTVDQPVPGIDRATFAYPTADGRKRATIVVFNEYERGQRVTVYVSRTDPSLATLAGETPESGQGWLLTSLAVLVGLVGIPFGARRLLRTARTFTVLRTHPWATWTMQAVYPKRHRLAVTLEGHPEEHLLRIDGRASRRLAGFARKHPILLAGSGRWFVVSPSEGRRLVALGRMDEPIERLHLVKQHRSSDLAADEEQAAGARPPVSGGVWAEPDPRTNPLQDEVF